MLSLFFLFLLLAELTEGRLDLEARSDSVRLNHSATKCTV